MVRLFYGSVRLGKVRYGGTFRVSSGFAWWACLRVCARFRSDVLRSGLTLVVGRVPVWCGLFCAYKVGCGGVSPGLKGTIVTISCGL